ncbi:hypothetical protein LO762_28870 [Actinocorallia sp. API 0066]|uniref:hypothetical protein n=1 Tax=Actinocorallia sp. API 0066 TaxID=2896846 RepID=UPI001E41858B|nr:hypothetical protein [Actinocorallia sp. API 0066]MCD0453163.1 hypothetical protein [Actinocorallia sp. API 0066]
MNEQGKGPTTPETRSRAGLRVLWLGLGALVTMIWFPPLGLGLGIAAIVVAVRTRRANKGEKTPGTIGGAIMGGAAVLFSALSLTLAAVVWSEVQGLAECQTVANTKTDEQNCRDIWTPKIEKKLESTFNLPEGSLKDMPWDRYL